MLGVPLLTMFVLFGVKDDAINAFEVALFCARKHNADDAVFAPLMLKQ